MTSEVREGYAQLPEDLLRDLHTLSEIVSAAKGRWILPRASRRSEYASFKRTEILKQLRT